MKKLLLILILILTPFSASAGYIEPAGSQLAAVLRQDFQLYTEGKRFEKLIVRYGQTQQEIVSENGNKFLRIKNISDSDSRIQIMLDRKIKGHIAVEFDLRINKMSYMQMPTLIGTDDGKNINQELSRLLLSGSGSISINNTSVGTWSFDDSWQKVCFYTDTQKDVCRVVIDGEISGETASLLPIYDIRAFDFLLRGNGQYIDIDNIRVYNCTLSLPEVNGAESAETERGMLLPLRREREPYIIKRFYEETTIDGELDEEWDFEEITKILEGESGAKADFAVGYTEAGLYIALRAKDDTLLGGEEKISVWLQDSFEIFIDGGNEKTASYRENDMQLTIVYGLDNEKNLPDGIKCQSKDSNGGWSCELFLPFEAAGITNTTQGARIGIDFGYNDCEEKLGERTAHFMWRGSNRNSVSTTAFGEGIFESVVEER